MSLLCWPSSTLLSSVVGLNSWHMLKLYPCGHVETCDSASKMTNQSSMLPIYFLHLVVYIARMQVEMNSCMRVVGPEALQVQT